MSGMTQRTFPEVFRLTLRRVLAHWAPFSTSLLVLVTALGAMFLYVYTSAIGRVDLFMLALDAKAALLVWMLVILFLLGLQLVILMASAWLYGVSVSMFSRCRRLMRFAALWLLAPLMVGFAVFVGVVFGLGSSVGVAWLLGLTLAATAMTYGLLHAVRPFRQLTRLAVGRKARPGRWAFHLAVVWMLLLTVVAGALSIVLIIEHHVGPDDEQAVTFVAWLCLWTLSMSLMPVVLFYWVKGDTYRRILFGSLATLVFLVLFLAVARGTMSSITYRVAENLQVRQAYPTRYLLPDHVRLADLDPLLWQTRQVSGERVEIGGYQLFGFGDLLLICPASLRTARLHQLPAYTALCISTRGSLAKRLPPKRMMAMPALPWRASFASP